MSIRDLYSYTQNLPDFEENFWDNLPFNLVYHATSEKNAPNILQNGIEIKNKTRGITNHSIPSAVFTSDNPDDISSYGNVVFEINVNQMKQDGYMPKVSKEDPIDESERRRYLAEKIGLNPDHYYPDSSDGLMETTVIFYNNIPAKYIKIL